MWNKYSTKITREWDPLSLPPFCSISPNRDVFSSGVCLVQKILPFHWWKDIRHSEMELLSKWPLTHHLYSQCSLALALPPSQPLHLHSSLWMFYCNCIQHLALQTADKPAQGQPPTLAMLINRLLVQAYQSPYPPSPCGCLWTVCSSHRNRSAAEWGRIRASSFRWERPLCTGRRLLCLWKLTIKTRKVYLFRMCDFFHLLAICSSLKQVVSPPQSFPECNTH